LACEALFPAVKINLCERLLPPKIPLQANNALADLTVPKMHFATVSSANLLATLMDCSASKVPQKCLQMISHHTAYKRSKEA
jgi:hypothetical protein